MGGGGERGEAGGGAREGGIGGGGDSALCVYMEGCDHCPPAHVQQGVGGGRACAGDIALHTHTH